uniref:Dehydrogenase n=1 Tax=Pristionchus pacificus TaxID=54126 RepID=A0A8R1Y821_PRIPA
MLSTLFGWFFGLQFTISVPFIAFIIAAYYAYRYYWELETVGDYSKKAVFISGCDSGFGRALAIKCANAGLTVFAGCLTKQGEDTLQAETKGLSLFTCPLDVTKDESVAEARKFVDKNLKKGIKLWAVVANAGVFTCYGPDDWCTMEDYKFSVEINTFGVVRCVQAFMDLIKENEGRIVAVSSVAGRVSVPASAPYSVAKYGVEAYIDCVRQETARWGVKCSLLEPGAFKTALLDKDAMRKRVDSKYNAMTPAKREAWGEEFKEWFINNWNNTLHSFGSSNINIVVNNYFHAVTAKYPRCRYLCGLDAVLFFLPFSLLDARIQDKVFALLAGGKEVLPNDLKKKFDKKNL